MDVYYINHLNEKILLDSENVILKYQELFNYSWDADTDNGKITSFTREMATYPITVTVTADSDEEFADILNNFHSIVVKDIINHKPGRLYIGDQYLSCYISGDIKRMRLWVFRYRLKSYRCDGSSVLDSRGIKIFPADYIGG